jgi:hypothetical protein
MGHAYGFNAQASTVVISGNIIHTVGRDGIQLGNIDGVTVSGNVIRRGGVTTLTDSDTPVSRYLSLAYAVGIDCSGLGRHCSITGNVVMNINGGAFDFDGLSYSQVSGNIATESAATEAAYTEDGVSTFGLGSGSITYGYQTSNSSLNEGGTGNNFAGNEARGMRAGAFRLYAARDCNLTDSIIHHPATAVTGPVVIGNIGTASTQRSARVVATQNTIYWDPASIGVCIAEDGSIGAFSGTDPNYVFDNKCIGNCYEFLSHSTSASSTAKGYSSSSSSLTTRQEFLMEFTGVGVSAAFKFFTIEGTTTRTMGQWNDYRDGSTRDSVLNISLDGAAGTGILALGDRNTFGFGDSAHIGFPFGYGYMAFLDTGNAASVYTSARANLLTDDWGELKYVKGTGFLQSISTSAGARVWTTLGSGGGGGGLPLTFDTVNNRIGLNNTSPAYTFDMIASDSGDVPSLVVSRDGSWCQGSFTAFSSAAASHSGQFFLRRARGSIASPSIVATADQIGAFSFRGFDGSAFQQSAIISAIVESSPGSNNVPMYFSFQTGTNSGNTTEKMRLTNAGHLLVGTGTDDASGALIQTSGFMSAVTGYYTTGSATDAIKALNGGVTAKYLIATNTVTIVEMASPPVSATGQARFAMDSSGHLLQASVNGGAYFTISSGGGGGGSPAGSNTYVQFNSSGSFGASPNLTFDGSVLLASGGVTSAVFNGTSTGASIAFQTSSPFNFQVNGNGVVACQQLNVAGSTVINGSKQFIGADVLITTAACGAARFAVWNAGTGAYTSSVGTIATPVTFLSLDGKTVTVIGSIVVSVV